MNVAEILRARIAEHPHRIALVDAGTHRTLTYAQLDAMSARIATALRARGLRSGDTVLILHPPGIELYAALVGMLRAGIVPAIPPSGAGLRALARCAELQPPRAVLAGGIGWAALASIPALHRTVLLSTSPTPFAHDIVQRRATGRAEEGRYAREGTPARADHVDDQIESRDDDQPAMLTFTSGSTGEPKALLRSHGVARAQVDALKTALALDGAVSLCTMPIVLLAELAAGATCLLPGIDLRRPGRADGALLAERMRAHGVVRVVASPALLANLAAALRARGETLPALRFIASGGAPVMPPLADALRAVAPNARLVAVYGSTEAEPITLLDAADISAADHDAMRGGAGLLAGTECAGGSVAVITTERGAVTGPFPHDDEVERRALAPRAVGEIVVRGLHVVEHYVDRSDDATTKIRAGSRIWHRTGDLGYRDERGRLWLVGRAAAAIVDARGTVEPLRVECALSYLPGIARSALAAADGARVLVVEPQPGRALDESAVRAAVAFARIDRVVTATVPVDPRHNAKVDYAALQRLVRRFARAA
ncbi:MAG TPA: AMP-binding protein [Candidatus Elarobacter sp.]|jgi:acyl-CoA synthetase (AMP-forming)/AMP-acid ligase II|nr:AMP-binding protein [Candidatus Elarobacter sp.]